MATLDENFARVAELCADQWQQQQYVDLELLRALAEAEKNSGDDALGFRRLLEIYNGSDLSVQAIQKAAESGNRAAEEIASLVSSSLSSPPYQRIEPDEYKRLRADLDSNPKALLNDDDWPGYPYYVPGRTYLYDPDWVRTALADSRGRFESFRGSRESDTAVLVGNGPSLNRTDLATLAGQDVFISNYAIKHPELHRLAKGVAVTNYLVAEQEPFQFHLDTGIWKFFPFWLRNTLIPDDKTILLNAQGGDLFCSADVLTRIAWHSTVSFFWLQILYSAGYRKVLMIGFDHSYHQDRSAKEGDVLRQTEADTNHFDVGYFRGKQWQAADVGKMEQAYRLARDMFESDGREIVNCTVGGKLEVFRRSSIEAELREPVSIRPTREAEGPRIAIVTPFWRGDVKEAERHWRLINRLGCAGPDHYHLFKHGRDQLPPVTMPKVICADIESQYPRESQLPHPAGPNLVFVHTLRLLQGSGYTHFFWLEPDCVPTAGDWLDPFVEVAKAYPDEPIVGTGGGTTVPGKKHWKHHFAGCSLYNIEALGKVDFERLLGEDLGVSFDVWLSVALGFISLGDVNDGDELNTIIFGEHRHDWTLVRRPPSLVEKMFEHWRPGKFLSNEQLWERTQYEAFSLFHAIKDQDIVRKVFSSRKRTASTIVINYNNGSFLREAIDSALDQRDLDGVKYEVVVVDDGSTDDSLEIIRSFGDRVNAVLLEHGRMTGNFNQQRALKSALGVAKGDVVMLLDGDDVFDRDKVASILRRFDDPDVVAGQHVLRRIDAEGVDMHLPMHSIGGDQEQVVLDLYQSSQRCNFFQPTSGLAFRRCYLDKALQWLTVDRFQNTWLDVRLTRLAPLYGKVFSLAWPLGSWRRHSRSDSISDDDLQERMIEHHEWFNATAAEFGIYLDYENSEQNLRLDRRKRLLCIGRESGAHFDETQLVSRLLSSRRGARHVMVDVGAHFGTSAAYFDALGWSIHCFEPDPSNRENLISRFGAKENVHIDARAVGEEAATSVPFYSSRESSGISGLLAFRSSHKEVGLVDVTTLAQIVVERSIEHIDFLKIDVEGHDFGVLKGAPWDRLMPDVVECEFEDAKTSLLGHSWRDVCEYLIANDYTVYVSEWHPIIRYGIPHDWHAMKKYPCELANEGAWGNLLAFRHDPGLTRIGDILEELIQFRSTPPVQIAEKTSSEATTGGMACADSADCPGSEPDSASEPLPSGREPTPLRSYARFGEYLRGRAPSLFQVGKVAVWGARFVSRHKLLALCGAVLVAGLVSAPFAVEGLAAYGSVFWLAAGVVMLVGIAMFSGALVHDVELHLARKERDLRREFEARLRESVTSEVASRIRPLGDLQARLRRLEDHAEVQADRMRSEIESAKGVSDRVLALERSVEDSAGMLADVAQGESRLRSDVEALRAHLEEIGKVSDAQLNAIDARLGGLQSELVEHGEKFAKLESRKPARFQTFNRVFTDREREVILTKWQDALAVSHTPSSLAYIAEGVLNVEQRLRGRLASSLEDAVLRVVVALAVKAEDLEVLEIGTLFGIGLAMIHERAATRYKSVHFTAIDPMEGYYGDYAADVLTGETVSREVLLDNVRRAGIPDASFTLLQGYSTDQTIVDAASRKAYDVLIIDGDHSYEGVKWDFDTYVDLVAPGGYVIIDDYANKDWPDVTKFVDDEVHCHPAVTHVGSSWRTAVFRKV